MERLRSGETTIPYELFLELTSSLPEQERSIFSDKFELKNPNWGAIKGGQTTYKKHKNIFERGRKIGSSRIKPKYRFDFNTELTPDLCELIGAIIGDGFTNKYGNNYLVQITGHKKLDKDYYVERLIPIIKKISPNSNPIISMSSGALRLTINSKEFHILLTKRFKMDAGKKTHIVKIPEEILDSKNNLLINSCLRGIFDTDGCVAFDKRNSYSTPYIRIVLQMLSKQLLGQVHTLLNKQGIKATITKNQQYIQINGSENCKNFTDIVGFSNPRHLNKLKIFDL
ncbi:hypothetical protein JXB27_02120 [Candidatus Woesearchaeota archaeon]|nr:hypothetical protein [Candidatus Woesearchaeota archaeon]